MYEFDTVDELKQPFYLDQYDELARVSDEDYPEEPVWDELRPSERFLISADAPALGEALDAYTEAVNVFHAEDDWPQRYQTELQNTLPSDGKDGVDPEYNDHFSVDLMTNRGTREYMMFDTYVATIQDELAAAENPNELQTLVERRHEGWYSRFGDVFNDWYDRLWDAVHIGDPPIIDIVTGVGGQEPRIHATAATAQYILEDEMNDLFGTADDTATASSDPQPRPDDDLDRYAS